MIGDLRVRLGLYVPKDTPDDLGGVHIGWEFLRAFWAKVEPRNVSETRENGQVMVTQTCLLYTSPSPRDATLSRMPSSA